MTTFIHLLILALSAAVTVAAVRLFILRGLDVVAIHLKLNSKTKGQLLGYATSMPELVVVIASAWAGVFSAGFWNIASSNIINWILFLAALFFYRQYRDLKTKAFFDELLFGILSVAIPLALLKMRVPLNRTSAVFLILLFVVYKLIDRWANPSKPAKEQAQQTPNSDRLSRGIILLTLGIVVIAVCGNLIGETAGQLIKDIGVPAWMVGWILGFVTSLPEMSSFFGIYALHKKRGALELTDDTQEALDTLVASNMSNLGIILPLGVLVLILL